MRRRYGGRIRRSSASHVDVSARVVYSVRPAFWCWGTATVAFFFRVVAASPPTAAVSPSRYFAPSQSLAPQPPLPAYDAPEAIADVPQQLWPLPQQQWDMSAAGQIVAQFQQAAAKELVLPFKEPATSFTSDLPTQPGRELDDGSNDTDDELDQETAPAATTDGCIHQNCGGGTCDKISEMYPQYTCDILETQYNCDCSGCRCESPTSSTSTTTTTTTTTAWQPLQTLVAGVFGRLVVVTKVHYGNYLFRAGRVRLRPPGSSVCGSVGSSIMAGGVKPHCAGSVCLGPTEHVVGNFGWEVAWQDIRVVIAGVYRICWCEPRVECAGVDANLHGAGCCLRDSDFSEEVGQLEVQGPTYLVHRPLLTQPFGVLELRGADVDKLHRVLLRPGDSNAIVCGEGRTRAEREASDLREYEIPISEEFGGGSVRKFEARVFRRMRYAVCWCPATMTWGQHLECEEESEFTAEIGEVNPTGPDTEDVTPMEAFAGAPFALTLFGNSLQLGDRALVVEAGKRCGQEGSEMSRAIPRSVCYPSRRRGGSCVTSTLSVNGGPNSLLSYGGFQEPRWSEAWDPVVVKTPGTYRVCWCVDAKWDPQVSDLTHCNDERHFAADAGLVMIKGIDPHQNFKCESFKPCQVRLKSPLPLSTSDGLLVVFSVSASAIPRCGLGVTGLRMSLSLMQEPNATEASYTGVFWLLPFAGPPGVLTVCYCHSASMGVCVEPVGFSQRAGRLTIEPPADGKMMTGGVLEPTLCGAMTSCTFALEGAWAMQVGDKDAFRGVRMRNRSSTEEPLDPCAAAVVGGGSHDDLEAYGFFDLFSRSMDGTDHWSATFGLDEASSADGLSAAYYPVGDYRFCYCAASLLQEGHHCRHSVANFEELGELIVSGVAASDSKWSCLQGSECNITVPGWRLTRDDAIRLVDASGRCGGTAMLSSVLPDGVEFPIARHPYVDTSNLSSSADYSFGRVLGTGRWKVCYCSAAIARNRVCDYPPDFAQSAGEISVEGAVASVVPWSWLPATRGVVSVLVTVTKKMDVTCAIGSVSLSKVPGTWDVFFCEDKIPGCLGKQERPWPAEVGANIVHVPISIPANISASLSSVHAWCTGEASACFTAHCAMPPTGDGLIMPLEFGIRPWMDVFNVSRNEPFDMTIRGDPINVDERAARGHAKVVRGSVACTDAREADEAPIGPPTDSIYKYQVRWQSVVISAAGDYRVCWCDREHSMGCAAWYDVGRVRAAGPTAEPFVPQMLNPFQRLLLNLTGIGLSTSDKVVVINSSSCSRDEKTPLPNTSSTPILASETGSMSRWAVTMPPVPGSFSLCWGPKRGVASTFLATLDVHVRRDCALSNWKRAVGATGGCSHICGGGFYEERRNITEESSGGGRQCPQAAEEFTRLVPCNEWPCPTLFARRALTVPTVVSRGRPFQVVLYGSGFAPDDDRILLVPESDSCTNLTQHVGGAACGQPGSNATQMFCGDGRNSLLVNTEGAYRICICDAWAGGRMRTNWTERGQPCENLTAYWMVPEEGALIQVMSSSLADEPEAPTADRPSSTGLYVARETPSHEEGMLNTWLVGAGALVCFVNIGPLCWLCWCRRARRCRRMCRLCSRDPKDTEVLEDSPGKTVRGVDAKSLVAQATKDVWEAYTRTMVESVYDVDWSDVDEDDVTGDGACDTSTDPSRPTTGGSTSTDDSTLNHSDSTGQTPATSRPPTSLSRLTTPASRLQTPISRCTTGNSRTPTGQSRPASGLSRPGSTCTHSSHPSLLSVPLRPATPVLTAPVGGSFLGVTLTGRVSDNSVWVQNATVQNQKLPGCKEEADEDEDGPLAGTVGSTLAGTEVSAQSSHSEDNVSPPPRLSNHRPLTPPGVPPWAIRAPMVAPLQLPCESDPHQADESQRVGDNARGESSHAEAIDADPNISSSARDKQLLTSSTARPPGDLKTAPEPPCGSPAPLSVEPLEPSPPANPVPPTPASSPPVIIPPPPPPEVAETRPADTSKTCPSHSPSHKPQEGSRLGWLSKLSLPSLAGPWRSESSKPASLRVVSAKTHEPDRPRRASSVVGQDPNAELQQGSEQHGEAFLPGSISEGGACKSSSSSMLRQNALQEPVPVAAPAAPSQAAASPVDRKSDSQLSGENPTAQGSSNAVRSTSAEPFPDVQARKEAMPTTNCAGALLQSAPQSPPAALTSKSMLSPPTQTPQSPPSGPLSTKTLKTPPMPPSGLKASNVSQVAAPPTPTGTPPGTPPGSPRKLPFEAEPSLSSTPASVVGLQIPKAPPPLKLALPKALPRLPQSAPTPGAVAEESQTSEPALQPGPPPSSKPGISKDMLPCSVATSKSDLSNTHQDNVQDGERQTQDGTVRRKSDSVHSRPSKTDKLKGGLDDSKSAFSVPSLLHQDILGSAVAKEPHLAQENRTPPSPSELEPHSMMDRPTPLDAVLSPPESDAQLARPKKEGAQLEIAPAPRTFDGTWFDGKELRGTISGSKLHLADGTNAELRFSGATSVILNFEGEDVHGELQSNGLVLAWSDGDTWTREVSRPQRPESQSNDRPDAADAPHPGTQHASTCQPTNSMLDGRWFNGEEFRGTIVHGTLHLPGGEIVELTFTGPKTVKLMFEGEEVQGRLKSKGQMLVWSDGDVWTKELSQPASPPTRSSANRIDMEQRSKRRRNHGSDVALPDSPNSDAQSADSSSRRMQLDGRRNAAFSKSTFPGGQQYASGPPPPRTTLRRAPQPRAIDDGSIDSQQALESWQGADLSSLPSHLRDEFLASQERIRAEWYDRLAADGHLRSGQAFAKSPSSSSSALPRPSGFGALAKGHSQGQSISQPHFVDSSATGPGPSLVGFGSGGGMSAESRPLMPGPPLAGGTYGPGPPLSGKGVASASGGSGPARPKHSLGPGPGQPSWAFCAP